MPKVTLTEITVKSLVNRAGFAGGDSLTLGSGKLGIAENGNITTDRGRSISIESAIKNYVENFDAAAPEEREMGIFGLGTTNSQDQTIIDAAEQQQGGFGFFDCTVQSSTAVSSLTNKGDLAGTWRPRALYSELSKLAERGLVEKLTYEEFLERIDNGEFKDEPLQENDSTRDQN